MKKQKKVWIPLLLSFILIIVFSGCSGVIGPKTAKIDITIVPNPVPFNSFEDGKWWYKLILSENNGIGVTLNSLRLDQYNQQEQHYGTKILYGEDIIDWFDSNYLPAFSALSSWVYVTSTIRKYTLLTVAGVDDNNNPIEATGRVDFLPQ
ncbi:unnamed protein product [marine sediment metagenome]|uniref:Uncharacterized protein n=1 Tax=marine sediment metagenome TaxID=412755 RepID=X0S272_9ZZZZ